MRSRVALGLLLVVAVLAGYAGHTRLRSAFFNLTGEENLFAQVRALGQLTTDVIRPRLDLRPESPIQYNGVNPFGINTFLQQEVEPAKRERQVQLIAEAGFYWLRQEFPWADIEISAKGNFDDCRNGPCISAWDKYEGIVALAEKYGLQIAARLSSPPDWSRADGSARGSFAPPDNVTDFADYAAAVAEHFRGRLRYYQIWNEPNIYPEWGHQPADPEAYTRLLCQTYARLKAVDPSIIVLSGVLAPTAELGADNGTGATNLNDFIFLQRMYDAGARDCFDILTVQGYGLWSGPTDHRLRPLIVNFGRNQLIRDVMVKNGDAGKAIWIAEMNWNAVPEGISPDFGQVTEEQQARYAPLAYQRAQEEWPWVGATMFWFFKRADDSEKNQAWYYFRMLEPDFTPLPVYASMKAYTQQTPMMYPGWFQEDHWAVTWSEGWRISTDPGATFGVFQQSDTPGQWLYFTFNGTDLILITVRGPRLGTLVVTIDGQRRRYNLRADAVEMQTHLSLAQGLRDGAHVVEIKTESDDAFVDGFIVRRVPNRAGALTAAFALLLAGVWWTTRQTVEKH